MGINNKFFLFLIFAFALFFASSASASYRSIWEVTPTDSVFFSGANCNVATQHVCPYEMGWEGNTVYYIFNLASDQVLSSKLELMFNIVGRNYGVSQNVLLEIKAGSNKDSLALVNSKLDINHGGNFSVIIDSSVFKKGATNYIKFYGTNIKPTGYGTNPPNFKINYIGLKLSNPGSPPQVTDLELLDRTEYTAAKFFYEQALSNGLVKDVSSIEYSSIAATGFGLTAFTIMAERYYGHNSSIQGAREFTTYFYNTALGRAPEAGAVDSWEKGYFQNSTDLNIDFRFVAQEMARMFFLSEEYKGKNKTDSQFITDCYLTFLRRSPSQAELNGWLGGQWNRAQAISIFGDSEEFSQLMEKLFPNHSGSPTNNFVTTMYLGAFDRLVDKGGLEYWVVVFNNASDKKQTSKDMAWQLFNSQEYLSKKPTNEDRVVRLYRSFLGRFPGTGEIAYWKAELDSGRKTLRQAINSFADSPEFAGKLDKYFGPNVTWRTYTPAQLRARTNQILDTIIAIQNNQATDEASYGKKGLLYHFIIANNKVAYGGYGVEISTFDNALLFAGVITAGEYFGGEVKQKAQQITSKADWAYFLKTPANNFATNNNIYYQFSHGWTPILKVYWQTWDRPSDETMLISIIALASNPESTDFQKSMYSWPRVKRSYAGFELVNSYFGSLFTYEFAHAWLDFEKLGKDKPQAIMPGVEAVNWWQNSINATKAARQFAIDWSSTYPQYGPDSWGLSAVQLPNGTYAGSIGALPTDSGTAYHNGTIAPYSSISAMPFFKSEDNGFLSNNAAFRTLRNYYNSYYWDLWGKYGPADSFAGGSQFSNAFLGIDQGPIALMIENYRSGFVWSQFSKNPNVKSALGKLFENPA